MLLKNVPGFIQDDFFLGEIPSGNNVDPRLPVLRLNSREMQFKIDTGPDVTIIPETTYEKLFRSSPELTESKIVLFGPGHNRSNIQRPFYRNNCERRENNSIRSVRDSRSSTHTLGTTNNRGVEIDFKRGVFSRENNGNKMKMQTSKVI